MNSIARKAIGLTLWAAAVFSAAAAQEPVVHPDSSKLIFAYIEGRDTIPWQVLPELDVVAEAPRHLRKRIRQWNRLRNAVYVTYPYARIAAGVLQDVDTTLDQIPTKQARKAYLQSKEEELKKRFGPKIEDLSIYQGKVLIKLIYRETGSDCYDIIKELKGGFSARLWQTVAFVFGSNLKTAYDKQENADIESIVQEIQNNPYYYNAYYYRYRRYN
jgi:hypothetical protein